LKAKNSNTFSQQEDITIKYNKLKSGMSEIVEERVSECEDFGLNPTSSQELSMLFESKLTINSQKKVKVLKSGPPHKPTRA
jgi:hypothetical protein